MAIIDSLVAKAKKQGFVTGEELGSLFPDADKHLDEIDALCATLVELGVEIVSAASLEEVLESTEPEPTPSPAPVPEPQYFESIEDLYKLYMFEIRQIRLLTAEDEVRLAKLMRRGERARAHLQNEALSSADRARLQEQVKQGDGARRHFVEANLRLVASVAWRYRNQGLHLLDLIQEGNIGLVKAVDRFDHRLGYKFSTYAIWWIRQAITRALIDQGNTIRLPVHVHEETAKIERVAQDLKSQLGKKPTPEQIAKHCGISRTRVTYLREGLPKTCSLDALLCCPDFPLVWDATETELIQQRPCPVREYAACHWHQVAPEDDFEIPPCLAAVNSGTESVTDQTDYSLLSPVASSKALALELKYGELQDTVGSVLDTLGARERYILKMRFGFDGEVLTLEEIGQKYDLTRERIRQVQARTLKKLRHPVRSHRLRRFW